MNLDRSKKNKKNKLSEVARKAINDGLQQCVETYRNCIIEAKSQMPKVK